jgi:hypothetical protein
MVAIHTPPKVTDSFTFVQQAQALVESYVRARDDKAKLEEKIFQLSQDGVRMEKANKALVAEVAALKAKYEPKKETVNG